MACMAACKDGKSLLACRFLLGMAEAGLYPGVLFYLSVWYTRKEQATRIALFYGSSTLAGVCMPLIDKSKLEHLDFSSNL